MFSPGFGTSTIILNKEVSCNSARIDLTHRLESTLHLFFPGPVVVHQLFHS